MQHISFMFCHFMLPDLETEVPTVNFTEKKMSFNTACIKKKAPSEEIVLKLNLCVAVISLCEFCAGNVYIPNHTGLANY